MSHRRLVGGLFVLLVLGVSVSLAGAEQWDLDGIRTIELDGVSGDVVVLSADRGGARVELYADVSPRDAFRPRVEADGATLRMEEDWGHGSSSGTVEWTLYVAGDTELQISTASGSLDAEAVSLRVDFRSASGDIKLRNVELGRDSSFKTASGDFEIEDMTVEDGAKFRTASGDIKLDGVEIDENVSFSTASGDVRAHRCTGHMSLSSASGNVVVKDSRILGAGKFSSASGDVELFLDELPYEGLSASSASGDVMLAGARLGGNYTLILTAEEDRGNIDSPYRPSSERTYRDGRDTFLEQRVERGAGGPEIELKTVSGSVVVRD